MTAPNVIDRRSSQLAGIFPGTSLIVLDRDFRYVVAAGQSLVADDSTGEAHLGLRARDVLPPHVWAALEPHCHAVLSGESGNLHLAGSREGSMLHLRTVPMWDKDGDEVESIMVLMKDQSDKVLASAEPKPLRDAGLHDPLTGLPGRSLMMELVSAAIEQQRSPIDHNDGEPGDLVLLFCSVDGFKHINDTYGHAAGDAALVEIARRLQVSLREGDAVARVGGDEFVVLHRPGRGGDADDRSSASTLAERLRLDVAQPLIRDGAAVTVSLSVGMTTVRGATTANEALRDADAAMHRAKAGGKNRVEFFDQALATRRAARRRTVEALASALDSSADSPTTLARLTVAYQPVYQLEPRRLVGFEALARLTGHDGESIAPDDFIPLAEETGMISRLGEMVLDQALAALADFNLRHHQSERTTMAVNVSASQAQHAHLPTLIGAALRKHGLEPADLVVELTESVLLESSPSTVRQLTELQDLGVGIAMDDFGTGYASLQYLATLPFDTLKVDKSFTHGMKLGRTNAAILNAVAALADELDKTCIVEGIETQAQLEALPSGMMGQGYLLGKPVPYLVSDSPLSSRVPAQRAMPEDSTLKLSSQPGL